MTETELTDRLRETIVLDGPLAWQHTSYLQDAQAAGIPLAKALKHVADISQEVSNNDILIQNIKTRIGRLALPSRSHLIQQDLHQIINAAASLNLSPDFVRNQWVPAVLQQQATASAPAKPVIEVKPTLVEPVTPKPEPAETIPAPEPTPIPEPEPVRQPEPPAPEPTPEPVIAITEPARPPETPPVVRSFTASPARVYKGQTVTLTWDVANLLAVTIDDLGVGLSPQNRGWVKPAKTTDYTLFDANNAPLSTVRVEVIKRDRSGIYGVLFAVALLALIYWFIKNNNSSQKADPERKSRSERLDAPATKSRWTESAPPPSPTEDVASDTEGATNKTVDLKAGSEPEAVPDEAATTNPSSDKASKQEPTVADARQGKYEEPFGNKPYDKVELGADDHGWRRARTNGRWGYVDANDDWVIEPEYEAVTPFRGDVARVFRDGKLITIDRSGEPVRNP